MKIKFLILSACLSVSLLSLSGQEDGMDWEQSVKFNVYYEDGERSKNIVLSSNMTYRELKEKVASALNYDRFLLISHTKPFKLDRDKQINLEKIKEHGIDVIFIE